ncbi:monovalent cation:proton antiporter family protein [Gracilibacillus alcaliphilus]|uniref:monovalent cation:proton antiporter family protein n=1 Tax=Gracilibacillus alcaliphilus TaxID=1401441 RepID=UPI00195E2969|nr:monovalent cation:proton antiporter family protein [Gracilibacillus alcaliphilus]
MEHAESVSSLLIVVVAAFLTPLILHRLKIKFLPLVVAEIIIGLIIGVSGFNLVEQSSWLETLSTLGFIFLMFLSGLEIDFSIFSSKKQKRKLKQGSGNKLPNPVVLASLVFLGIFMLSFALSYGLVLVGLVDNVYLMTLIISTISLGVVVPTLKEAQAMQTTVGQTILLIAVIADLVTMILLAVFVSFYSEGSGNMWLLLILFVAGILLYFVANYFRKQSFVEAMSKGTIQIGTRAVFTLIMLLVALSESIGAENILGAFLAGALVSLLSPKQELIQKLDSFGYGFFIPIFFVMVGAELDLWALFNEPRVLLLIPVLFIALLVSKVIPVAILRRWYDTKTVIAASMLLTSTLSLVIAAATIGERLAIITTEMHGALVLVAVLSCIITPVFFKKYYVNQEEADHQLSVAFIGLNQATVPVLRELDKKDFKSHVFHTTLEKVDTESQTNPIFDIAELDDYDMATLDSHGVFEHDIVVATTGDEATNKEIAVYAKQKGVERVIARIETTVAEKELQEIGVDVFSVLLSTKTLLKALIESPNVANIFTQQESALFEINMNNGNYDGTILREFPFTGDVIMVRIFRGKDSIVPHGDTELRLHDRLIVTGSPQYAEELRQLLEHV